MADITASMVKELREKTGAGMMDCKNALKENGGDMDVSVDWLRTKGLAKAAKKSGRVAAEGLVAIAVSDTKASVVELNSETDFVARNEQFQELVKTVAELALDCVDGAEALGAAQMPGAGVPVSDHINDMIATIGENMSLRRSKTLSVKSGVVAAYVHNQVAANLGKIGVLVALESSGDKAKLEALGKQLAMHVAATNPLSLTRDELDQDVIAREKAVFMEQARESGKPENIIEKMVEGRLRKFFQEVVLLSQTFVIDGENTIEKVVKNAEADVGAPVEFTGFVRFELGEGIEKKDEDFAAEVAAVAGS